MGCLVRLEPMTGKESAEQELLHESNQRDCDASRTMPPVVGVPESNVARQLPTQQQTSVIDSQGQETSGGVRSDTAHMMFSLFSKHNAPKRQQARVLLHALNRSLIARAVVVLPKECRSV